MFWIALILAVFPQAKADRVYFETREKKVILDTRRHTTQKTLPFEKCGRQIAMSKGFLAGKTLFSGSEDFNYLYFSHKILVPLWGH